MKLFISWSGETSKQIALVMREWVRLVFPTVQPFLSSEDIRDGARWNETIGKELSETQTGLICLTPENLRAPWIHFEAGAVSKSPNTSTVIVLPFVVKVSEVPGTLSQFQVTPWEKEKILHLAKTINSLLPLEHQRKETELAKVFEMHWPELAKSVSTLTDGIGARDAKPKAAKVPLPDQQEAIERILLLLQEQQRAINEIRERMTLPGPIPIYGGLEASPDNAIRNRLWRSIRRRAALAGDYSRKPDIKKLLANGLFEDAEFKMIVQAFDAFRMELPSPIVREGLRGFANLLDARTKAMKEARTRETPPQQPSAPQQAYVDGSPVTTQTSPAPPL
ncbi:MAG TPA: toll/interleukin-1 receptor domain-containing protein [Phycisphaerae bacterium]|nr:toll/interleukin-1 receptor domain-containing protein [Phycisphaerae bacterium]